MSSTDNNDGISVIDVTNPTAPSYCFVSVYELELAKKEVPALVPLSAEQYVRAYYPKYTSPPKPGPKETEKEAIERRKVLAAENDVQDVIAKLQDVKLIDLEMLAEAWPAEYDPDGKLKGTANIVTGPVTDDVCSPFNPRVSPAYLASAIERGATRDFEARVWMPGGASAIKAALRLLSPFPDAGMELLMKVMEKEVSGPDAELDLTGLSLSSAQLEKLVSPMKEVSVVNLSHMPTLDIDGVCTVLAKFPRLKRLNLLGSPSISADSIYSLLHTRYHLFNHLESLIHPSLLGELKDAADCCPYCNAFSFIGVNPYTRRLKACSLPFFTPSRVIQALIDTLQPLCSGHDSESFLETSFPIQAAFSSVRAPGQKWSERDTVIIPQLSLRALKGEGWTFAMNSSYSNSSFAFLRFKSQSPVASGKEQPEAEGKEKGATLAPNENDAVGWEIHDLASFVNQLVLDGKPRPPDDLVNNLQDTLTILQTTKAWRFMADDDVRKFLDDVTTNLRYLY